MKKGNELYYCTCVLHVTIIEPNQQAWMGFNEMAAVRH